MIITTTETVPNREITQLLDIARGSTVRAKHVGRDIAAAFKNLVGGELNEYTQLQAEAREQALARMTLDAEQMGADAVVNVRFQTSMIAQGACEVFCYGTAVKLKKV